MPRPTHQTLHSHDPTYLWKLILRTFAIICASIGIGTIAWALSRPRQTSPDGLSEASFLLPWDLICLALSILWNFANVAVLLTRCKAIHPGANVGCDLLLWLGFLVTGTFVVFGALNYLPGYYGGGDYYEGDYQPPDGGQYVQYSNGSYYEEYSNGTLSDDPTLCPGFSSCDAQKDYLNSMNQIGVITMVGAALSYLVLIIHFALFISACRYTHARRNDVTTAKARAITAEATVLARQMIAEMTGSGGLVVPGVQQAQPLLQSEEREENEQAQQPPRKPETIQLRKSEKGKGKEGQRDTVTDPDVGSSSAAWGMQQERERERERERESSVGSPLPVIGEKHPALREEEEEEESLA